MNLESNIKKYYFYNFFKTFSFWLPIFVLYFLDAGLTYAQLFSLSAVTAAFNILFEIPSGVFADYFGRKKSLVISAVLKVICMFFYFFGDNFYVFATGSAIFGMSLAFESGTNSAFIYDTLKDLKREKEFKKIEGRAVGYSMLGIALGGLMGGFLAEISFKLPLLITAIAFAGAIWVSLLFVEPKKHKKSDDKAYFKHLKDAAIFSYKHPRVKWLIIFSGLMVSLLLIGHRFLQPYMRMVNIDIKFFGIIYFVWLIFSTIGARYAHKIESKLGEFLSLLIIPVFAGIYFLFIGNLVIIYGVVIVILGQFVWGFSRPVIRDYINKHVESHHRATVLSLHGFFGSLMVIILAPLLGYFTDLFSLTTTLIVQGIIVLVGGIPLVFKVVASKNKVPV